MLWSYLSIHAKNAYYRILRNERTANSRGDSRYSNDSGEEFVITHDETDDSPST